MRSNLKQPTPQCNSDRVGAVVGSQFVHEVLDVEVCGGLRDRQLIGNLLVAISISDEPEHVQFPGRKIFFSQMLSEAGSHLWRNMSLTCMDGSDNIQQFVFRHALKDVS